ncbi:MAG: hypothetical protein HPY76_07970 [Anaerolineae bacterium]|nr:hypothetical protein [Anaerolineae bacterium]
MESNTHASPGWLTRPLSDWSSKFNLETLLVILILVVTIASRFIGLGDRVMSHDEVNHVVPSFDLYEGRGYRQDPVTHGPLQFHLIAFTYFLFGDNDFTSRVPAALFSVAAVAFVLIAYRRYLGRTGALVGGVLFMISPYMLFYGRYTRNEGLIELLGVVMLYALLRYLETGRHNMLYLLTASLVLHFTAKETSYIYTAQLLLFIGVIFLGRMISVPWQKPASRDRFLGLMLAALAAMLVGLGLAVVNASGGAAVEGEAVANQPMLAGEVIAILASLILAVTGLVTLVRNQGWGIIRAERSFDVLILVSTLVLPQLTAFPVKIVGWDPLNYQTDGLVRTGIFLVVFLVLSVVIGLWWRPNLWLKNAAIFYGVFVIFYTTFFTNGQGFFTGIVGSLGYWLSQQGVERGSQPLYYYGLIQIPVYEYLAALGALAALYLGIRYRKLITWGGHAPARQPELATPALLPVETVPIERAGGLMGWLQARTSEDMQAQSRQVEAQQPVMPVPALALFLFWSLTSLVAFSLAGEKMPWLTVHIALPLLLSAAWAISYLIDSVDWKDFADLKGLAGLLLVLVFLFSTGGAIGSLLGTQPPFQGKELAQLQATSTFLLSAITAVVSGYGLSRLLSEQRYRQSPRLFTLGLFAILTLLTVRTSYRAAFINYDYATEYLVYAHAAPGPKQVLAQIEEISRRTTGGLDIVVSHDDDALYPYWWYFRHYPNHVWYQSNPSRTLLDSPLIVAGEATMSKVDSLTRNDYIAFNYTRLWWPNQDYYNLTWERIWNVIKDPQMRAAVFKIWLDRDYSQYAELTNNTSLTPETWSPASAMKFYVRKDVIAEIWNYGSAPVVGEVAETDPYTGQLLQLAPDVVVDGVNDSAGPLFNPRDIAVGSDGSLYIVDFGNNRIVRYASDGRLLGAWGSLADVALGSAPGGTFKEPWGIATAPDGSVYVADTWNHRIQKFTADGQFVTMWGYFGQGEAPDAFYGPRDVAVDSEGNVYVTDTGNKRVVVFTPDGGFITQFGSAGFEIGQFDEPVGLTVDDDGLVYVADTWNQRIQVFQPSDGGIFYSPLRQWDVAAWYGSSLENKPYIDLGADGDLYIADPEGYRVLRFDAEGNFKMGWGQYSLDLDGFGLVSGVAAGADGHVWVSDGANNRVMRYTLP